MGFFTWMAHPKRRKPAASAFISLTFGIGIYYEATETAWASKFINQAQSGVNFGNSLLLGGQEDARTGAGQQEMQGFAGTNPTQAESGASSYYIHDNVGLSQGNSLNQASSDNAFLMSDPTCPSGWPGPLTSFESNAVGDVERAQSLCGAATNAEAESIQETNESSVAPYSTALAAIDQLGVALSRVKAAGEDLQSTCAPTIQNQVQYAPACNLLSQQGNPTLANLSSSWEGVINNVANACRSLPTSVTSAATAGSLTSSLDGITGQVDTLLGSSNGQPQVSYNGSIALPANYASTTAASQEYQEIYGECTDAESYLENISTYPGGLNSYTTDPMLNEFLANPANQGMINKMMPFIESNPEVFSQYYQNVACTNNNIDIPNSDSTSTSISTTTTSTPTIQSNPVACTEPLSTYTSTGWINSADWPDPNAKWIYGTTGGCGGGVPNGQTEMLEGTYSNTTGAPIDATLYVAADDEATVTIDGTQVASYSDGGQGGNGAEAYPATGGVVSEPVALPAGPDEILLYVTNAGGGTAANPSAGILSIIANGQVLIDTNSSWLYLPSNGSSSSSTVTVVPGQTVSTTAPNTHAQSILCNSSIQCMGTECHALFGNQDLHFSQALTALSALQQMEQNFQCAQGTSIAAGNCQPILFAGDVRYCRTWPLGGVITNNCCKEGLTAAAGGPNLTQYLTLTRDAWDITANSNLDGTILGNFHSWAESGFKEFDSWAADGWRYVTSVFKGAAQSVENAFGLGGANAAGEAGGALGQAGEQAAQAGTTGAQEASKGLISGLEDQVKNWLFDGAKYVITAIFGPSSPITTALVGDAGATLASHSGEQSALGQIIDGDGLIGGLIADLELAYLIYQIIHIIGELVTACRQEEFKLGEARKVHRCQNLGTYCTQKVLGFCLEHKDVFCCYGSPLDRIIASQIRIGQPNVAGSYGSPKHPDCGGFTPDQLAEVDWSHVSLSAWTAMLQKAGLISGSNAAGSAMYTTGQIDHSNGNVEVDQAPQPLEE